jgi:hypothetical protein
MILGACSLRSGSTSEHIRQDLARAGRWGREFIPRPPGLFSVKGGRRGCAWLGNNDPGGGLTAAAAGW